MMILVNDETKIVKNHLLADVIIELGYGETKVATAIDGQFVPRSARPSCPLYDGCRLEILPPMHGC